MSDLDPQTQEYIQMLREEREAFEEEMRAEGLDADEAELND